jgi:hypothetical protein
MARNKGRDDLFAAIRDFIALQPGGSSRLVDSKKGPSAQTIEVTLGGKTASYTVTDIFDFTVANARKSVLRGLFCHPRNTLIAEDKWPEALKEMALPPNAKRRGAEADKKPEAPKGTPKPAAAKITKPVMQGPPPEPCYTVPSKSPRRPVVVEVRRPLGRYTPRG